MPIKIKPVGARGGPRGAMEASRNEAKDKKQRTIESLAKKMAKAANPTTGRISDQDLSRALSMVRGMLKPQAKKAGGKVKKAKGMAKGGKMKSKGMARGGKMKSKGMARGGKAKR